MYSNGGRLIQVIAPDGSSTQYSYDPAGNILSIQHLAATTLAETGTSNASGTVGSTLTIYGSGFSTVLANDQVWINGVLCTVVSATANSITVIVPGGATSGPITITVNGNTVTSSATFTVATTGNAPAVTGISPQIAAAGTAITVSGSNFQTPAGSNKIYFGGNTFSSTSSATATSLATTVPSGYPSGKVTVSTPNGNATSTQDVFVPPSGYSASSVGFTGRAIPGGASTTMSLSTANTIGMVLFDGVAGQVVSLEVANQTFPSNCGWATIQVVGPSPSGYVLASNNFCTSATRVTLPQRGTYTVIFKPNGSDTGSLSLTLVNAPPVLSTIAVGGAAVTTTTTIPAQQAIVSFTTSAANQVLSVAVSGSTYPSYCGAGSLAVAGPTSVTNQIANTSLCNGAMRFTTGAAGTYALVVTPNGADTGQITLQLYNATPVTGTISAGGSAVTVATTAPQQQAFYSFTTTTANQVMSLEVTGSTYQSYCAWGSIVITGPSPSGTQIGNTSFCSGAMRFTTGAAGTYTITVSPNGTDTGQVSLQLFVATPVSGSISGGGSTVTAATTIPAQQELVSFTTTADNQVMSLEISNSTYPSNCGWGNIVINGPTPSNTQVGNTNFCNGAMRFTTGAAGTYVITVTPNGTDTGQISLQLFNATPVTAPIGAGNSAVTAATNVPAQQELVSFTTTADNQVMSLEVNGSTYPSNCGWGNIVINGPTPSNTQIGSTSFCNGAVRFTTGAAGTYVITVTPSGTDTGQISLQLFNATPVTTSVNTGSAVTTATTVPAQQSLVSFTTTSAGQVMSLGVSGSTYPSNCGSGNIVINGPTPSNTQIASTSFCNGAVGFTTGAAGTYIISVTPSGTDTGQISLQLYNASPVTASIAMGGSAVTTTTTAPTQQEQLSFTTTVANQVVSLQISGDTFPSFCQWGSIYLIGPVPQTSQIGSANFCAGAARWTIATPGTYTITVAPYGSDTGQITLQLFDATPVTATIAIGGAAVTTTTTIPAQQEFLNFSTSSASQAVTLVVSADTFPSFCQWGSITVTGPSPSTSQVAGGNFCPYTWSITAGAVGTYTITVTPTGADIGQITLQLQ